MDLKAKKLRHFKVGSVVKMFSTLFKAVYKTQNIVMRFFKHWKLWFMLHKEEKVTQTYLIKLKPKMPF